MRTQEIGSLSPHRASANREGCVIASRSERRALSVEAETRRSVIPAQPVPSPYWGAGIQVALPGFRVAACGLARNDGLP